MYMEVVGTSRERTDMKGVGPARANALDHRAV